MVQKNLKQKSQRSVTRKPGCELDITPVLAVRKAPLVTDVHMTINISLLSTRPSLRIFFLFWELRV